MSCQSLVISAIWSQMSRSQYWWQILSDNSIYRFTFYSFLPSLSFQAVMTLLESLLVLLFPIYQLRNLTNCFFPENIFSSLIVSCQSLVISLLCTKKCIFRMSFCQMLLQAGTLASTTWESEAAA